MACQACGTGNFLEWHSGARKCRDEACSDANKKVETNRTTVTVWQSVPSPPRVGLTFLEALRCACQMLVRSCQEIVQSTKTEWFITVHTHVDMILEYDIIFIQTRPYSLKDIDAHQAVQVTGVQVRVGVAEEIPDELPEEIPDEFETPQVTCKA